MTLTAVALRDVEQKSLYEFVHAQRGYFRGKVLDYGAGQQPYAEIVKSTGATYVAYDRADFPANVSGEDVGARGPLMCKWDAILCTQVIQYVPDVPRLFSIFHGCLLPRDGHLVLTYPTTWPEVEAEDRYRFTKHGIDALLGEAGFEVLVNESRATVDFGDVKFSLGGGAVARAIEW